MNIPFQDLTHQNKFDDDFIGLFKEIVDNQKFVLGKYLEIFEQNFARYNDVKYTIGVANGSEAIEIIIRALELDRNSHIILPANTFIATAQSVIRAGHIPVLADINSKNMLSEIDNFTEMLNERVKVFLPVHLYGQIPNMAEIKNFADHHGIKVIEDAAQSQGSSFNARKMGFFSQAAATSFYPGKNLGAWGDGGAILTNSESLDSKIRMIRNYGSREKYKHEEFGINSRLDEIQATVLIKKLLKLDLFNDQRRAIAEKYDTFFEQFPEIKVIPRRENFINNYHLYVIRVPERDKLQVFLNSKNIETLIHYPTPIYLHAGLKKFIYNPDPNNFPVTNQACKEVLSLPLYPGLSEKNINYILNCIEQFYK